MVVAFSNYAKAPKKGKCSILLKVDVLVHVFCTHPLRINKRIY